MKFIRRILILMGLFFALYFFGDFRVNDVNVRDYLQSKITLQQMKDFGRKAADVFQMLADLIRHKTGTPTTPVGQDISMDAAKKLVQDSISEEDRKKILKIFEENVNTGTSNKKEN
jgi:hypothetical protein